MKKVLFFFFKPVSSHHIYNVHNVQLFQEQNLDPKLYRYQVTSTFGSRFHLVSREKHRNLHPSTRHIHKSPTEKIELISLIFFNSCVKSHSLPYWTPHLSRNKRPGPAPDHSRSPACVKSRQRLGDPPEPARRDSEAPSSDQVDTWERTQPQPGHFSMDWFKGKS